MLFRLGGTSFAAVFCLLSNTNVVLSTDSLVGRSYSVRHPDGGNHLQQERRTLRRKEKNSQKKESESEDVAEGPWSGDLDDFDADINDFESDDEDNTDNKSDVDSLVFTPAQPLSFFKDAIDPKHFEWVNKEEIAPGSTTCGFLKPPLGSVAGVEYPTIEVYMCMKFATTQPAPKGNLFVHCGGPSSLSSCLFQADYEPLYEDNYNKIAIDQRGMGRSEPSFFQEEFKFPYDEYLTGPYDATNATSIEEFLDVVKARAVNCWPSPAFQLQADSDPSMTYHFLEYSGTRQLAEDLDRFRTLINAPKLSVHGVSYGTQVVLEYATLFPNNVDLLVSDSNMPASSDMLSFAKSAARGANERINYLYYSCDARNMEEPGSCPVDDMVSCINNINDLSLSGLNFELVLTLLLNTTDATSQSLCDAADSGDVEGFLAALPVAWDDGISIQRRRQDPPSVDCSSQPTSSTFGGSGGFCDEEVYGKPYYYDFKQSQDHGAIAPLEYEMYFIFAQDYYGSTFNKKEFVRDALAVGEQYEGLGSGYPATWFVGIYAFGFYWPRNTPLPPRGHPAVKGIVSGQQYDFQTPYSWTQETRANFPSTTLMTVQFINHGLDSLGTTSFGYTLDDSFPSCKGLVDDYLETGQIGFADGFVCSSPFPTKNNMFFAWNNFAYSDFYVELAGLPDLP